MKVEYLIIVKQDGTFCDSKEGFINLLAADSRIEVDGNVIKYNNRDKSDVEFTVEFMLYTGEIPNKGERFFHLTLTGDRNGQKNELASLIESVRRIVKRISPDTTSINTLWDDIGRQYAIEAYPFINEVENLMRKLISKFMLVNVGMQWSKEALHKDVADLIKKKSEMDTQTQFVDDLYKVDFIVLSQVLFKPYRALSHNELDKIISTAEKNSDIDIDEVKGFLPKSNWERYFADKVECDGNKLKEKWERLYKLRNDVAHNRNITQAMLGEVKGVATEIKQVIEQAIEELDNIELADEEKQNVVDAYQSVRRLDRLVEQKFEPFESVGLSAFSEVMKQQSELFAPALASSPLEAMVQSSELFGSALAEAMKQQFELFESALASSPLEAMVQSSELFESALAEAMKQQSELFESALAEAMKQQSELFAPALASSPLETVAQSSELLKSTSATSLLEAMAQSNKYSEIQPSSKSELDEQIDMEKDVDTD